MNTKLHKDCGVQKGLESRLQPVGLTICERASDFAAFHRLKPGLQTRWAVRAFTLIEILIAMFIFMLILTAVYSIWHGIIRGTQAGIKAVQEVQRSRMAMHCLEQALLSARVFQDNMKYYYFESGGLGKESTLSMTCRLPADFLGMGF